VFIRVFIYFLCLHRESRSIEEPNYEEDLNVKKNLDTSEDLDLSEDLDIAENLDIAGPVIGRDISIAGWLIKKIISLF
jgi:hypothetical protein